MLAHRTKFHVWQECKLTIMYRLLILMFSASVVCNLSIAQSKVSEDYQPVDIDSLLFAPVSLPENKSYVIQNVEFSVSGSQISDIGPINPVVRHRFNQFNRMFPDQIWEFGNGSAYFKVADSTLTLTLVTAKHSDKLLEIYRGNKKHIKLTIRAKTLIGKFKQYSLVRDFLIQDIRVDDK